MNANEKSLMEAKANILKALGHPTRLWMAEQLAGGEKCVCELAENIDADFSTISKHLTVLKQAGVVIDEKRGKQVFYRLKVPCILNLMPCIEAVLQATAQSHIELMMDGRRSVAENMIIMSSKQREKTDELEK